MKPVTALAVIVVVFLVILGIVFWQLGLFNGTTPETTSSLIEPISPTDLAGLTSTGLAGVPTYYDSISSTGGLDPFYTAMTPVQPTSTSYTVKPGDTLWIIAQHFYNDGTKWKMIQDANKLQNPSKLKVGMVLTIPDASDTSYRTTAPAATDTMTGTYTPATTGTKYHKVVKGDTLWKLARKYYNDNTKTDLIFEANRDKMATRETSLQPGWKLLIPDAPKKESKPKTSTKKTAPKKTTTTPSESSSNTTPAPATVPTTPTPAIPSSGDNTPTGVGD
ncbi:MAG: LysM peptidoglycan-binding domain-containing protein [Planctomycetes bacterium]|nr:LysM peptidoglycan-binding domain-containing protein [Planctomycetota bacterium]